MNEALNAIHPVDVWPNSIERPWSLYPSRFETVYRNSDHIPLFATRPYELREGTNMEILRHVYNREINTQARSLSPLLKKLNVK